jgi:hypothetical protein
MYKIMFAINRFNILIPQSTILLEDDSRLFQYKGNLGKVGKIGTPYIYTVDGVNIIIKVSQNINIFSRSYTDLSRYRCFEIYSKIKDENCFPSTKNNVQVVVGSSEYVNETIIGFLLNKIFFNSYFKGPAYYSVDGKLNEMSDLGQSVFQIGYFQNPIEKVGYNVMEICDNTLDNLVKNINDTSSDFHKIVYQYNGITYNSSRNPEKIYFLILQQINNILQILKNMYSFNHGDLKGGNMFYRIDNSYLSVDYPLDAYEYMLNNKSRYICRTNLRIKIADYGKASMTFDNIHYYCNDTKYNANKLVQYVVDPEKKSVDSYKNGKYLFDSDLPLFGMDISLRHLPCPYFLSADYYLLLTSLSLSSGSFFNFIDRNGIYKMLEVSFDRNSKRPESIVSAFKKLKGQYLKCNIINEVTNYTISKLIQQPKNSSLTSQILDYSSMPKPLLSASPIDTLNSSIPPPPPPLKRV